VGIAEKITELANRKAVAFTASAQNQTAVLLEQISQLIAQTP